MRRLRIEVRRINTHMAGMGYIVRSVKVDSVPFVSGFIPHIATT